MKKQTYAKVFGSPGTGTRITGLLHTQWPLLIIVALTGYLARAALPHPAISTTTAGILFLLLAVAVAAASNRSRIRIRSFLKGAKGEEITARELSRLPDDFAVFHGLDLRIFPAIIKGGSDFDHIVVGPNGIFVIETKNWTDDITIENGNLLYAGQAPSRPPLEQVKTEAKQLQSYLKSATGDDIRIQPILCFASNNLKQGEQGSVGVIVCNADSLNSIILAHNENVVSDTTRMQIVKILAENCD